MDAEIDMNNIISWRDLYRYLPGMVQTKGKVSGGGAGPPGGADAERMGAGFSSRSREAPQA